MEYLLRQRPGWLRGYISFGCQAEAGSDIGQQALIALSIRVAAAALAFGAQMVLARWLGSFEFGIFTYAAVWLNVAGSLCAAGFGASALRFLPAYQASGDTAKARGFLVTGRGACLVAGAAGALAMSGYALVTDPD
jgi:O-antigen/teichoic acid export membrane protein